MYILSVVSLTAPGRMADPVSQSVPTEPTQPSQVIIAPHTEASQTQGPPAITAEEAQTQHTQPEAATTPTPVQFQGAPPEEWLMRDKLIDIEKCTFDTDLKYGQIRVLTASVLEQKKRSFLVNPPSAPVPIIAWARDAACMCSASVLSYSSYCRAYIHLHFLSSEPLLMSHLFNLQVLNLSSWEVSIL